MPVAVAVVVVMVDATEVTSVVGESVSAMAEEDDSTDAGGVWGDPKFSVEEDDGAADTEAGGVWGDPKFKVDEEENESVATAAEEEDEGGVAGMVEGDTEVKALVLVVLSGQGPKGECASIDVPWGAIVIETVSEILELQGKGEGRSFSSPTAEDDGSDAGGGCEEGREEEEEPSGCAAVAEVG